MNQQYASNQLPTTASSPYAGKSNAQIYNPDTLHQHTSDVDYLSLSKNLFEDRSGVETYQRGKNMNADYKQMDVNPGEEGFAYRPYGGGVDVESSYTEGTYFIPPWNDIITYNILQQSKSYESTVMDVNGTDISVEVAVNFSVEKGNAAKLHLRHGIGYIQFIDIHYC